MKNTDHSRECNAGIADQRGPATTTRTGTASQWLANDVDSLCSADLEFMQRQASQLSRALGDARHTGDHAAYRSAARAALIRLTRALMPCLSLLDDRERRRAPGDR